MKNKGIGPVLFREKAKFYRELNAGDQLVIDVQLARLSDDPRKWSMQHRCLRSDELCTTINLDGAWLDLRTRRIAPPPKELVEKFEALERTVDFKILVPGYRNKDATWFLP